MTYSIQIPTHIDLSLERITQVLHKLGDPHRKIPEVIHVAGTNGKGSTIAFLKAILEGEGKVAHVYTSPHLIRPNERIQIAGQDIKDDLLDDYISRIQKIEGGIELSYFEELTVATFLAFSEHPADYCLIEVGLGGRLDATNVIIPVVSVITSISYDHQDYLGDTIEAISKEKAGIIKEGIPVVCALQRYNSAREVVIQQAQILGSPFSEPMIMSPDVVLSLKGGHQYENAATAVAIAEILLRKDGRDFYPHLQHSYWPGRLQKIFDNHDIWVDGAHNEGGIKALLSEVRRWKDEGRSIVLAVSQLSNRPEELLIPLFDEAIEIYHIDMQQDDRFQRKPDRAKKSFSVDEALSYFMQPQYNNYRILFTGSLYMVGEVLNKREKINDCIK